MAMRFVFYLLVMSMATQSGSRPVIQSQKATGSKVTSQPEKEHPQDREDRREGRSMSEQESGHRCLCPPGEEPSPNCTPAKPIVCPPCSLADVSETFSLEVSSNKRESGLTFHSLVIVAVGLALSIAIVLVIFHGRQNIYRHASNILTFNSRWSFLEYKYRSSKLASPSVYVESQKTCTYSHACSTTINVISDVGYSAPPQSHSSHAVYCPVAPHPKPQLDSDGCYSKTFSSDGGTLNPYEVALTIPIYSVPLGTTFDVKGKTHTNLKNWESCIDSDNGEVIISPVSEYHVKGGRLFENHVTIVTPHIVQEEAKVPLIRVLCGDKTKKHDFTPIPHMRDRANKDMAYFSADESHVFIHTKSFLAPHFICTVKDRDLLIDLQALVLYDLRADDDLRIRVRLCDRRTSIPEFREALFEYETMKLVEACSWRPVRVPNGRLTNDCQFTVELKPSDKNWVSRTVGTNLTFPLTQTRNVSDIIEWQAIPLADFLLVSSNEAPPRPFKGTILISVKSKLEEDLASSDDDMTYAWIAADSRYEHIISCTTEIDVTLDQLSRLRSAPTNPEVVAGLEGAFEYVSRRLALKESFTFYRRLGLHEAEVDSIREGYKDQFEEQKMQALLHWRRRDGSRATVPALVSCLRAAGAASLADKLTSRNISTWNS